MSGNFNYISFGNPDLIDQSDVVTMRRGRMFEYTPTDIEKRLESLGKAAIDFLEELPTFLCSEIGLPNGVPTMTIKYGRIARTKYDQWDVSTNFITLVDFGDVRFTSIDQAQRIFGADTFQLHRTHWAVRNGDAHEILNQLTALKPNLGVAVARTQAPGLAVRDPIPPPREKKTIGDAASVEDFLKLLYELPRDSIETFFRGHEDARFELTPSLLRKSPQGAWQFMRSEDRLCKELLIAHYDEFQGDQYCFDRLVRMQHYGLPTRLLDISGNPLVALFFACYCAESLLDTNGEVIVFRISESKIKYYDSDTVSCLANLSNLTYTQKSDFDLKLAPPDFNETPVAKKLLHHIRSEKGFFQGRIVPGDLGSIICVKAKRNNTRIKSQSGAFLLFGHEAALPESGQEGIDISRITITDKGHILKQLDSININATTVYPSIDQTTVHLRERYRHTASST